MTNIIQALNDNAQLSLDEIGFGDADKHHVRHRQCPLHPDKPEHHVSVYKVRVDTGILCEFCKSDHKKTAMHVYMADKGIDNLHNAATHLLDALIAKHGRDGLDLSAL